MEKKIEDQYAQPVGYTVDYESVDIQRGGDIPTFREAKQLLIDATVAEMKKAERGTREEQNAAYDRYNKAWGVQNPDRFTT